MLRSLRTAVRNAPQALIHKRTLTTEAESLPLLIEPAVPGTDLASWVASETNWIEQQLHQHGAILFRGFGLSRVEEFEAVAAGICSELYEDYGDLPPEGTSGKIYQSTPYPPEQAILFHNESSHLATWPLRQFFFCVQASPTGGDTPLLNCREICRQLAPEILQTFAEKGLLYIRNFVKGVDVSWRQFFRTDDRLEVERVCGHQRMECEWMPEDGLRLRTRRPAVLHHPVTGDQLFFNQVQLHHVACLPPQVRESLSQICRPEDFPRQVYFGDGSEIPADWMQELDALYWRICQRVPWQNGDLIVLDNMLTAHARCPYAGPRRIAVAMGRMTDDSQCRPATTATENR